MLITQVEKQLTDVESDVEQQAVIGWSAPPQFIREGQEVLERLFLVPKMG